MNGSPDLSVNIGRLQLKNPVMPASGTFGYGEEYSEFLDLNRLGAIIVKTITLKPRIGSHPHRSAEVPSGLLASIGLQNVGIERFLEDKLPFFDDIDVPLIVNIGGQSIEEYAELASILNRQRRVDALELNISCPNVSKGGMHFGVDPEVMRELVKRVRNTTEKTLIVKLTPVVTDIRLFGEICQQCGADGLSLINAPLGMSIDINTRRSKLGRNMTGGLAGPAIKPIALYLVWQVCKTVDIPVIGIGGISSLEDALEFFIAGASAIQIGTWNFVNPSITMEIIDGLQEYMVKNKIEHVSQLIGTLL
ncbi:MAG: dihydroorotate dehydrogenase [Desulfobacteraceae bacterium]|jgi:dihydroorotate dehydrogenase (NAD+) catalytic subunit